MNKTTSLIKRIPYFFLMLFASGKSAKYHMKAWSYLIGKPNTNMKFSDDSCNPEINIVMYKDKDNPWKIAGALIAIFIIGWVNMYGLSMIIDSAENNVSVLYKILIALFILVYIAGVVAALMAYYKYKKETDYELYSLKRENSEQQKYIKQLEIIVNSYTSEDAEE